MNEINNKETEQCNLHCVSRSTLSDNETDTEEKKEWFEDIDWDLASIYVGLIGGFMLLSYGIICTYYG